MSSMLPPTVWLPHPIKHDISALGGWGRIRHAGNVGFIFSDMIPDSGVIPYTFAVNIVDAAKEFDAARDYLALTGDPIQIALFVHQLTLRYRKFNVLRWNNETHGYVHALIS